MKPLFFLPKITNRFFYCILILSSGLICCKKADWFDIKSDKNLSVPTTLQDFEMLLDNYNIMNLGTPGLGEMGSDGHFVVQDFEQYLLTGFYGQAQFNAYTWSYSFPYEQVLDWNASYERIFQCNLVLDGLKKIKPIGKVELEQYNRIKGNALFHRAKSNFDLAQVYAQPYNLATASSDLGIPLKDGIDVTAPAIRASVVETYNQIIKDLDEAKMLLPNIAQLHTRGSRSACFALLARTYLIMQDFSKALENVNSALGINNSLIDFNTVPATAENLGLFNEETIFHSELAVWAFIFTPGVVYISPDLYDLYREHDLRKSRFFKDDGVGIVFKGMYSNTIGLFSGLATDEVYLIRAECYARTNKVSEAMADLNYLLKSRWDNKVSYQPVTAENSNEALNLVLTERKKELLLRGIRWSDLRRLNQEERFKTNLSRTVAGKSYTLEANSYKYTLPIPNDVMRFAPQMKQSPGW